MSILYLRLPARASVPSPALMSAQHCAFALATANRAIEREGSVKWSELGPMVSAAERVVLILAASDINVLKVAVPPVNLQKLRLMLPNLVEDQLLGAPEESVIVSSKPVDGQVCVAIADKAWLEELVLTVQAMGARAVQAVPAQMTLASSVDAIHASIDEFESEFELVLRLSPFEGLGVVMPGTQAGQAGNDLIQTVDALVPEQAVQLYVQQGHVPHLQSICVGHERVRVLPDSWSRRLEALANNGIDLMSGLARGGAPATDWKRWRWAFVLGGVIVFANAVMLNVEWLRMKREADRLNGSIIQTFQTAMPKTPVSADPAAQLRKKLQAQRRDAGDAAPDDFLALSAAFGEEWRQASGQPNASLASLEFKDHALIVRPKPEQKAAMAGMQAGLRARNLTMTSVDENTWKVGSGR